VPPRLVVLGGTVGGLSDMTMRSVWLLMRALPVLLMPGKGVLLPAVTQFCQVALCGACSRARRLLPLYWISRKTVVVVLAFTFKRNCTVAEAAREPCRCLWSPASLPAAITMALPGV
jgi:hypothetical protein